MITCRVCELKQERAARCRRCGNEFKFKSSVVVVPALLTQPVDIQLEPIVPLDVLERMAVVNALLLSQSPRKAAKALGISRCGIYKKIAQYGIELQEEAK